MKINSNHTEEAFLLNQSGVIFRPFPTIAYQHALLLQLKGQHTEAVKQLDRALIAYPGKFKDVLESAPAKYRQEYLSLFSEVQLAASNEHNKK